jgi:hypothetical protein
MSAPEGDGPGATSYALVTLVHDDENETRPPDEVYGVFRTKADEQADLSLFEMLLAPSSKQPGRIDLGQLRPETVRTLQRNLPASDSSVIAAITTTGAVCYGLRPEGGGSCKAPHSSSFTLSGQDLNRRLLLYGLIEDGVTGVEFIVGGETRKAALGTNSYAVVVDAPFDNVSSVVLHRQGSSDTIPIG